MMKLVVISCVLATAAAIDLFAPNYRGPLSLAPGQPAEVLGSDGRPLDTLEVNLDRAAHYTAKALSGDWHFLKKRSLIAAPIITPYAGHLTYAADFLQPYNYRGPLSLAPGQPANILGADGRPLDTLEVNLDRAARIAADTGLHLLKKRSVALLPSVPSVPVVGSPLIVSNYAAPIASKLSPIPYARPIVHVL